MSNNSYELQLSPKYLMKLINEVEQAIWDEFRSYKEVRYYVEKWQTTEFYGRDQWENFSIIVKANGDIDLLATLHSVGGEIILKMAIDLGIDTPDFLPSIPIFRNEIKSDYKIAFSTFEKAIKQIESHPDIAIGLANSALESIIKEFLKEDIIRNNIKGTQTLYGLTIELLKVLQLFPHADMPLEIKVIGSSLLAINQNIEKLRSEKTNVHGKTIDEYVVSDPMYAYFIVNSVTTIGLFLNSFFKNKISLIRKNANLDGDDLPF